MKLYCGRDFSADDMAAVTHLITQNPTANCAHLSRQVCVMFHWLKLDGGLKDMTARVAMLRMQKDGLITLPASQRRPSRRPEFLATAATDAQPLLSRPVHELAPLSLRPVAGKTSSRLWNEYMARYHYLGYTPLAVNNARFLILPWIQSQGLASKILPLAARQLPNDWQSRYGYRPVLLETFVESERHRGTCYKAANWIPVGKTAGRGKKCPTHKPIIPIKDIWLYPLRRDFVRVLCR